MHNSGLKKCITMSQFFEKCESKTVEKDYFYGLYHARIITC